MLSLCTYQPLKTRCSVQGAIPLAGLLNVCILSTQAAHTHYRKRNHNCNVPTADQALAASGPVQLLHYANRNCMNLVHAAHDECHLQCQALHQTVECCFWCMLPILNGTYSLAN